MSNPIEPRFAHRDDVVRMLKRMAALGLKPEDVSSALVVIAALDDLCAEERERERLAA